MMIIDDIEHSGMVSIRQPRPFAFCFLQIHSYMMSVFHMYLAHWSAEAIATTYRYYKLFFTLDRRGVHGRMDGMDTCWEFAEIS